MQADSTRHKRHYAVPRIGPKFPVAAFFALLCAGFLCLYAAATIQPRYADVKAYQSLYHVIAAGNRKTVSDFAAVARKLALPLHSRKLSKQ